MPNIRRHVEWVGVISPTKQLVPWYGISFIVHTIHIMQYAMSRLSLIMQLLFGVLAPAF